MKYFRIFFLLILADLLVSSVLAQSNQVNITVTPSVHPDTINKPSVVEVPHEKNLSAEGQVTYETQTVAPSTTSVSKASAVTVKEKQNATRVVEEKNPVNYSEQKVEKNEVPANGAAVIPK